ncbi:hypothetical protein C8Q78DRAFT_1082539 [Trametes maxima]|nr:hypothetical protein C8Q78DRAFT_1082539 [Trametes maxima]
MLCNTATVDPRTVYGQYTTRKFNIEQESLNISIPFRKVQAFHKLKFLLDDAQDLGVMEDIYDVAHARPQRLDSQRRTVPGRFDTVIINDGTGGHTGVEGYEIGQLRLVFKLPKATSDHLFPGLLDILLM